MIEPGVTKSAGRYCRVKASGVETGMLRCRLASIPLIAGLLIATSGLACAEPKALLELFTSQGCSSCPSADKLLGEFANDPSLIALSDPIDYWDYLGWKDTLAMPGHSARQRAYAHVRGDRDVYTPQIVVNGSMDALGSDRAAIEHTIALTDEKPAVMSLPVLLSLGGGNLNVNVLAKGAERIGGEVWLCPLARAVTVEIGRGENHGRTITYHNVVRRWLKLGEWNGTDAVWSVPMSEIKGDDIDAAAVMVQQGTREKPGIILGAAYTQFGASSSDARQSTNTQH
jgi:hypothetical protein